jgi:hypothetical protein
MFKIDALRLYMTDHLWSLLMCLTSPDTCSIWENSAFKCILTIMGATQTRSDDKKYELFWGLNISDIITLRADRACVHRCTSHHTYMFFNLFECSSRTHQCVVPKIPLGWYFLVVKYGNTTGFELHFVVLPARKHGVNSIRGGR